MKLFSIILTVFLAAVCPALTVFQPWDSNDWVKAIQPDNTLNVRAGGASYVTFTPIHRNNLDGFTGLYKPIGTLIPAGTSGGNVPEFWMQFDFRYDGEGAIYNCLFGLYNTSGGNSDLVLDRDWIGVQIAGQNLQAKGKNSAADVLSQTFPNNDLNLIERVKMHIYTYNSDTVMDVEVYVYDPESDTATLVGQLNQYIVLSADQFFLNDIDAFGLRNIVGVMRAWTVSNLSFDNLYFSTDGPKTDTPAPSFAQVCNRKAGDYNNDCNVDFKDLAIMSEDWLRCSFIPARLCVSQE